MFFQDAVDNDVTTFDRLPKSFIKMNVDNQNIRNVHDLKLPNAEKIDLRK